MSRGNERRQRTLGSVTRSAIEGAAGINSNSFYDSKSGLSMVVVLALALSWIPYVGPIVAGFVGGRRAGSIVRGFVVGVFGSLLVFGIAFLLNLGLMKLFEPQYQSFMDTLEAISPSIVVGLESISSYLSDNFVTVASDISVSVQTQTYASILGFAMIGGVFADQARKELRIIVSQSMDVNRPRPARSTTAFVAGRDMGFQNYDDLSRVGVKVVSDNDVSVPQSSVMDSSVPTVPTKTDLDVPDDETTKTPEVDADVNVSTDVPDDKMSEQVDPAIQENKPSPDQIKSSVPVTGKNPTADKPSVSDDLEWF